MKFITLRPWAVVPSLHLDATKHLRVIYSVDPQVIRPNFLDYVIVLLQLFVTTRQRDNVAVINPRRMRWRVTS